MLLVKMAAEESRMAGLSLHRKLSISVHRRSENLVGSVIFGMKLWAINVWKYTEKETWWWQEETRKAVALQRETFKEFQMNKGDENKEKCREANRASRKAVRIAKDAAYEDLYKKLDFREGIKMVYKLAKIRDRRTKDISEMPFINSLEGQILTVGSDIMLRWQKYFEGLLNTENTRK